VKIAPRELNLLFATLAVVLLAVTYLVLEPSIREWAGFRERQEDLLARRAAAQQLLDSRETVENRLAEFRAGVPTFPEGRQVESELLRGLDRMAGEQGLVLTQRRAEPEREAGDLYEISIICDWTSDLDSLVHFLYAQQSQGVVSDVRGLSVRPDSGRNAAPGQLGGSFTIDYAYRRESGANTESPPAAAGEEPAAEGAQPPTDRP